MTACFTFTSHFRFFRLSENVQRVLKTDQNWYYKQFSFNSDTRTVAGNSFEMVNTRSLFICVFPTTLNKRLCLSSNLR